MCIRDRSFIWDCCHQQPLAAYPNQMRTTSYDSYLALLQVGFTLPLLLPTMRCALTTPFHPYPKSKERGGIFSVALSVNSHPPDVIWHFVLRSPDFPPMLKATGDCPANSTERLCLNAAKYKSTNSRLFSSAL